MSRKKGLTQIYINEEEIYQITHKINGTVMFKNWICTQIHRKTTYSRMTSQ